MESDIIALIAAVAAVASAVIAAVSAYLAYRFKRADGKAELERELDRILELGIQYPRFEYAPFTNDWVNHRGEDNDIYLRYDIYCKLIFNFIHHVYKYYNGKKEKIEDYINSGTELPCFTRSLWLLMTVGWCRAPHSCSPACIAAKKHITKV